MIKIFYVILPLCFFSLLVFSQEKIEKEIKVPINSVPDKAINWLDEVFNQKKKLKWFIEKGEDKVSYEAKFIRKRERYSVEFKEDGNLEDIEIYGNWRKLPLMVRNNISDYSEAQFSNFRIVKIQIQYSGTEEAIKNWIDNDELDQLVIKYEIEFYGEKANKKKLWEGLFDKDGHILMRREIILTPSNNLFF